MNIQVVRIFNKMREVLLTHKDLLLKVEQLEGRVNDHDNKVEGLFEYIKELIQEKAMPRKRIGFKIPKKI